jgi:hypothetical protein
MEIFENIKNNLSLTKLLVRIGEFLYIVLIAIGSIGFITIKLITQETNIVIINCLISIWFMYALFLVIKYIRNVKLIKKTTHLLFIQKSKIVISLSILLFLLYYFYHILLIVSLEKKMIETIITIIFYLNLGMILFYQWHKKSKKHNNSKLQ